MTIREGENGQTYREIAPQVNVRVEFIAQTRVTDLSPEHTCGAPNQYNNDQNQHRGEAVA